MGDLTTSISQQMGDLSITPTEDDDDWIDTLTPEEMHARYHDKLQMSYAKEHSEWDRLPYEYLPDRTPEGRHYPPVFGYGVGFETLEDAYAFARKIPDPLPNHESSLFPAFNTMARHFKREGLDVTLLPQFYYPKPPHDKSFILRLTNNYCEGPGWQKRAEMAKKILKELDPTRKFRWYLLRENFAESNRNKDRENWCTCGWS